MVSGEARAGLNDWGRVAQEYRTAIADKKTRQWKGISAKPTPPGKPRR